MQLTVQSSEDGCLIYLASSEHQHQAYILFTWFCGLGILQSLLHQLKEGLFSPLKGRDLGSHPPVRRGSSIINNGAGLSAFQSPVKLGSEDKQNERSSPAGYLLDADERAARLAARGTVALFDVPQLKTTASRAALLVPSYG